MNAARLVGALACVVAVFAVALVAGTADARAEGEGRINSYSVTPSTTQAGGHPDLKVSMWLKNEDTLPSNGSTCNCRDPRSIVVDLPGGVIADPGALPQCTASDFALNRCSANTQIGIVQIGFNKGEPPLGALFPTPVYNLTPRPGQTGLIAFPAPSLNTPIFTIASSRTEGDYGLSLATNDITHVLLIGTSVVEETIWGVPSEPSHDAQRLGPPGCDPSNTGNGEPCVGGFPSSSLPRPYLFNPTTCGESLVAGLEVKWYDLYRERATAPFPPTTGCGQLGFNPSLFGRPTTTGTETASGFDVDLEVPQPTSPTVPLPSSIRGTEVTLPPGFTINANAADGKEACTDQEANIGIRELAAECPEFAKIGSLSVETSVLPGPLPGFVYLAEPRPGERYRILLVADGFGVHVKLPGSISADPATGQLRTTLQDLPQFPFTRFNLHFFGSERGILATPSRCGTYPVTTRFTPWNSAQSERTSTQYFTLSSGPGGGPCPGAFLPFSPGLEAGVTDKTAGIHAPFELRVTRGDGEQQLSRISVTTPPGFAATLRGVPYCPPASLTRLADPLYSGLAELSLPACPAASRVGQVVAGAGAGSRPLHVGGNVYLAGPYRGAPLSLAFSIPAVSGPYDLGDILVRVPISVDPTTARVTALSDPLPQIVDGIPLRTRSIMVDLDRPGFTLNPTNCRRQAVDATISGVEGAVANPSTHFQVANCEDLGYRPKLRMTMSGGLNRRAHPAIRAIYTTKPGEANSRRIAVTLPKSGLLDNSHIETICTRVQFAADSCPAGSIIGHAVADTSLLDSPLTGPVVLLSSSNRLPDMAVDLEGQIEIQLRGRIDSAGGRLRTTFEGVPDAPVTRFDLRLQGGKKGLLINSTNLCAKRRWAKLRLDGQNGRTLHVRSKIRMRCGSGSHRARRKTVGVHQLRKVG